MSDEQRLELWLATRRFEELFPREDQEVDRRWRQGVDDLVHGRQTEERKLYIERETLLDVMNRPFDRMPAGIIEVEELEVPIVEEQVTGELVTVGGTAVAALLG